jgi:hypothetical protein
MLPDFRFILGAIVAMALMGVAGLGLVTSVHLVREAHMGPLEDSRTLAFADHTEWNQFYDPDAARRFEEMAGRTESLATQAAKEPLAPPEGTPVSVAGELGERTASIPGNRGEAEIPDDTPPQTAPVAATPAVVTLAAAPGAPASDVPEATESEAPPTQRVATAPALSPGAELPQETQKPLPGSDPVPASAQPEAANSPLPDPAPTPRARPKILFRRRAARAHIRRFPPITEQMQQIAGFLSTNPLWPGYDGRFTSAPTTWKTGKPIGPVANHPQ